MAKHKKRIIRSNSFIVEVPAVPRYGHQDHIAGTGKHQDKRQKRNRTRSAQRRQWISEQE